jgi:hypothetical protein
MADVTAWAIFILSLPKHVNKQRLTNGNSQHKKHWTGGLNLLLLGNIFLRRDTCQFESHLLHYNDLGYRGKYLSVKQ